MRYSIYLHQVVVLARDHDGAERTVRRELEDRLGGAAGVMQAFLAAGGEDYGVGTPASDAGERWRAAAIAALDAAHLEFPALLLRLDDEDLEEALAEEFVTIELADLVSVTGAETGRLPL